MKITDWKSTYNNRGDNIQWFDEEKIWFWEIKLTFRRHLSLKLKILWYFSAKIGILSTGLLKYSLTNIYTLLYGFSKTYTS